MEETTVSSVRTIIKRDPDFRKLVNLFSKSGRFTVDIKSLSTEIGTIQKVRLANKVDTSNDAMLKQVIDNSARDQSFRSRLAEITFQAFRSQYMLTKSYDRVRRKVTLGHKDQIYKVLKTQGERQQLLDDIFGPVVAYINDMKHLSEMANIIIVDIDKSAWGLKLIVEALNIHAHKERLLG